MSEKRKIDDKDLEEVKGAGDLVPEPPAGKPPPPGGHGGSGPPDTDDQGGGDQDLGQ